MFDTPMFLVLSLFWSKTSVSVSFVHIWRQSRSLQYKLAECRMKLNQLRQERTNTQSLDDKPIATYNAIPQDESLRGQILRSIDTGGNTKVTPVKVKAELLAQSEAKLGVQEIKEKSICISPHKSNLNHVDNNTDGIKEMNMVTNPSLDIENSSLRPKHSISRQFNENFQNSATKPFRAKPKSLRENAVPLPPVTLSPTAKEHCSQITKFKTRKPYIIQVFPVISCLNSPSSASSCIASPLKKSPKDRNVLPSKGTQTDIVALDRESIESDFFQIPDETPKSPHDGQVHCNPEISFHPWHNWKHQAVLSVSHCGSTNSKNQGPKGDNKLFTSKSASNSQEDTNSTAEILPVIQKDSINDAFDSKSASILPELSPQTQLLVSSYLCDAKVWVERIEGPPCSDSLSLSQIFVLSRILKLPIDLLPRSQLKIAFDSLCTVLFDQFSQTEQSQKIIQESYLHAFIVDLNGCLSIFHQFTQCQSRNRIQEQACSHASQYQNSIYNAVEVNCGMQFLSHCYEYSLSQCGRNKMQSASNVSHYFLQMSVPLSLIPLFMHVIRELLQRDPLNSKVERYISLLEWAIMNADPLCDVEEKEPSIENWSFVNSDFAVSIRLLFDNQISQKQLLDCISKWVRFLSQRVLFSICGNDEIRVWYLCKTNCNHSSFVTNESEQVYQSKCISYSTLDLLLAIMKSNMMEGIQEAQNVVLYLLDISTKIFNDCYNAFKIADTGEIVSILDEILIAFTKLYNQVQTKGDSCSPIDLNIWMPLMCEIACIRMWFLHPVEQLLSQSVKESLLEIVALGTNILIQSSQSANDCNKNTQLSRLIPITSSLNAIIVLNFDATTDRICSSTQDESQSKPSNWVNIVNLCHLNARDFVVLISGIIFECLQAIQDSSKLRRFLNSVYGIETQNSAPSSSNSTTYSMNTMDVKLESDTNSFQNDYHKEWYFVLGNIAAINNALSVFRFGPLSDLQSHKLTFDSFVLDYIVDASIAWVLCTTHSSPILRFRTRKFMPNNFTLCAVEVLCRCTNHANSIIATRPLFVDPQVYTMPNKPTKSSDVGRQNDFLLSTISLFKLLDMLEDAPLLYATDKDHFTNRLFSLFHLNENKTSLYISAISAMHVASIMNEAATREHIRERTNFSQFIEQIRNKNTQQCGDLWVYCTDLGLELLRRDNITCANDTVLIKRMQLLEILVKAALLQFHSAIPENLDSTLMAIQLFTKSTTIVSISLDAFQECFPQLGTLGFNSFNEQSCASMVLQLIDTLIQSHISVFMLRCDHFIPLFNVVRTILQNANRITCVSTSVLLSAARIVSSMTVFSHLYLVSSQSTAKKSQIKVNTGDKQLVQLFGEDIAFERLQSEAWIALEAGFISLSIDYFDQKPLTKWNDVDWHAFGEIIVTALSLMSLDKIKYRPSVQFVGAAITLFLTVSSEKVEPNPQYEWERIKWYCVSFFGFIVENMEGLLQEGIKQYDFASKPGSLSLWHASLIRLMNFAAKLVFSSNSSIKSRNTFILLNGIHKILSILNTQSDDCVRLFNSAQSKLSFQLKHIVGTLSRNLAVAYGLNEGREPTKSFSIDDTQHILSYIERTDIRCTILTHNSDSPTDYITAIEQKGVIELWALSPMKRDISSPNCRGISSLNALSILNLLSNATKTQHFIEQLCEEGLFTTLTSFINCGVTSIFDTKASFSQSVDTEEEHFDKENARKFEMTTFESLNLAVICLEQVLAKKKTEKLVDIFSPEVVDHIASVLRYSLPLCKNPITKSSEIVMDRMKLFKALVRLLQKLPIVFSISDVIIMHVCPLLTDLFEFSSFMELENEENRVYTSLLLKLLRSCLLYHESASVQCSIYENSEPITDFSMNKSNSLQTPVNDISHTEKVNKKGPRLRQAKRATDASDIESRNSLAAARDRIVGIVQSGKNSKRLSTKLSPDAGSEAKNHSGMNKDEVIKKTNPKESNATMFPTSNKQCTSSFPCDGSNRSILFLVTKGRFFEKSAIFAEHCLFIARQTNYSKNAIAVYNLVLHALELSAMILSLLKRLHESANLFFSTQEISSTWRFSLITGMICHARFIEALELVLRCNHSNIQQVDSDSNPSNIVLILEQFSQHSTLFSLLALGLLRHSQTHKTQICISAQDGSQTIECDGLDLLDLLRPFFFSHGAIKSYIAMAKSCCHLKGNIVQMLCYLIDLSQCGDIRHDSPDIIVCMNEKAFHRWAEIIQNYFGFLERKSNSQNESNYQQYELDSVNDNSIATETIVQSVIEDPYHRDRVEKKVTFTSFWSSSKVMKSVDDENIMQSGRDILLNSDFQCWLGSSRLFHTTISFLRSTKFINGAIVIDDRPVMDSLLNITNGLALYSAVYFLSEISSLCDFSSKRDDNDIDLLTLLKQPEVLMWIDELNGMIWKKCKNVQAIDDQKQCISSLAFDHLEKEFSLAKFFVDILQEKSSNPLLTQNSSFVGSTLKFDHASLWGELQKSCSGLFACLQLASHSSSVLASRACYTLGMRSLETSNPIRLLRLLSLLLDLHSSSNWKDRVFVSTSQIQHIIAFLHKALVYALQRPDMLLQQVDQINVQLSRTSERNSSLAQWLRPILQTLGEMTQRTSVECSHSLVRLFTTLDNSNANEVQSVGSCDSTIIQSRNNGMDYRLIVIRHIFDRVYALNMAYPLIPCKLFMLRELLPLSNGDIVTMSNLILGFGVWKQDLLHNLSNSWAENRATSANSRESILGGYDSSSIRALFWGFPFVFDLRIRLSIFRVLIRYIHSQSLQIEQPNDTGESNPDFQDPDKPFDLFSVCRSNLLDHVLRCIAERSTNDIRTLPWKVEFEGEEGLDIKGLRREMVSLASRSFFQQKMNLIYQPDQRSCPILWEAQQLVDLSVSKCGGRLVVDVEDENGEDSAKVGKDSENSAKRRPVLADLKQITSSAKLDYLPVLHKLFHMGQFIAKCLLEGEVLDGSLSEIVLSAFLVGFDRQFKSISQPKKLEILHRVDPEIYGVVTWIMNNHVDDSLYLNFTIPGANSDHDSNLALHARQIELCVGGSERWLNEENKAEFIELVIRHRIDIQLLPAIKALCLGFHSIIPIFLLNFFIKSSDELEMCLFGDPSVSVAEISVHAQYTQGYTSQSPQILWLWEVLEEVEAEDRNRFLRFVTGSPHLPLGGLSALDPPLSIQKVKMHHENVVPALPTASTCFNLFKLPCYDSLEELRDRVLYAIREGSEGFAFS